MSCSKLPHTESYVHILKQADPFQAELPERRTAMDLGIAGVAAITVIAYVIGLVAKATRLNNKWIPIICAVSGAVLGIAGLFVMPDFPAGDVISAAAVGVVSGLAATGLDQTVKQVCTKGNCEES